MTAIMFMGVPVAAAATLFLLDATGLPLPEVLALLLLLFLVLIMCQVFWMVLMEIFSLPQLALLGWVLLEVAGLYGLRIFSPDTFLRTMGLVFAAPLFTCLAGPALILIAGPAFLLSTLVEVAPPVLLVLTAAAVLLMLSLASVVQMALAPRHEVLLRATF